MQILWQKNLEKKKKYFEKAKKLKESINNNFWMEDKGCYRYIVDYIGGCDYNEGLGHAFAIKFGIADDVKANKIFKNQHITNCGIPCVWPSFQRYIKEDKNEYGRHSGTVWPHIQSFWADAATEHERYDLFEKEFNSLTKNSVRDGFFSELYHPDTTCPYGGLQEKENFEIVSWNSEKKQTWSATGYLNMIFSNIIGMKFDTEKVVFKPYLPKNISYIKITDLDIRNMSLEIEIKGCGNKIKSFLVNGKPDEACVYYEYGTNKKLEIVVE